MHLYLHIPFCKKKCNYCDFVSYAGKENLFDEYVEALIREINNLLSAYRYPLSTIYFGGGTPTLLSPKHFEKLLGAIIYKSQSPISPIKSGTRTNHKQIPISNFEITIESNPGTADLLKLKALRKLGINRLSIGVQSFNDKHLKTLGRIHSAQEAIQFYKDARAAGFDNINLDLMFALPDQTLDEWKQDLAQALALGPEHLSTYNLEVEEGTPLWKMTNDQYPISNGGKIILNLPSQEIEAEMYEYTIETLTKAGYKHYEISSFAKPGFECKHNIAYWKNENYIGVGAGAHSHVNGKRWANPNCIEEYMGCAARNVGSQKCLGLSTQPIDDSSRSTYRRETIFMGLRLLDGLETEKFEGFEKEVEELIADGLLVKDKNNIKLTHRGLFLANVVFERFV